MQKPVLIGLGLGMAFGFAAAYVAVGLAGGGHGSYVAAHLLFPWGMLIAGAGTSLFPVVATLALAQFPVYGGVIGLGRGRAATVAAVHAAGAVLALWLRGENFIP